MKRLKANGLIYSDSQSDSIKPADKGEVQVTPDIPKQTLMRKTVTENRVKSNKHLLQLNWITYQMHPFNLAVYFSCEKVPALHLLCQQIECFSDQVGYFLFNWAGKICFGQVMIVWGTSCIHLGVFRQQKVPINLPRLSSE